MKQKRMMAGFTEKTVLLAASLLFIFPLYIAIVNSFKTYDQIVKNPLSLPLSITFDNFRMAWERSKIGELYLNSIFITVCSLILILVTASMLAYIIARNKTRMVSYMYVFVLAGFMVPAPAVLIPSLKTLKFLHLDGSMTGLFLFYAGTYMSIAVFFYVEFIKTIPQSIEESGVIDGAGTFTIFFKLVLPLLKPCTATVFTFLSIWIWNDFLPPMYILGSDHGRTITTGIYNAVGRETTDWNIVFSCSVLASLPIVAVYLLAQKQFISGLTAGAVKG
ncbi:carbohydrate ABC transporter permease [Cohnella sp. REN36]|uniref:carbohydrate ABC transporter permease n=1 Tax=Cohnella sp. REN36 TaxID=2887347 RepID=UPI001D14FF69|nr:carbohydrate ABC transporter permease [Cohnella sp. REN36]MCC3372439.1 carbohydrate ABC transporter permease [Cohnella sp. REN36]